MAEPTPPSGPAAPEARTSVADVTVERETAVTVVFEDGHRCTFGLEELRAACPCAGCRADRDRGEVPWPKSRSPLPLSIVDAQFVGAWGLQITWNDRHATGIYPWDALRSWCESGQASYPRDSGLGGIG